MITTAAPTHDSATPVQVTTLEIDDEPPNDWKRCIVAILKYSWLNVLLVCIPISCVRWVESTDALSWSLHFAGINDVAVFTVSALAIVPLAALLGFATEEISERMGPALGGLCNATLGNAIELIVSIIALADGKLRIVQSAMVGSILSNALLVLGTALLAGGLRYHEQTYELRSANVQIGMLGLSALSIVIPSAFSASLRWNGGGELSTQDVTRRILEISRGTAVILILVYASLLFMQLKTHAYLFTPSSISTVRDGPFPQPPIGERVIKWKSRRSSAASTPPTVKVEPRRKLTLRAAIVLLLLVTALAGVTAEWLVDSIDGLAQTGHVSQEFIALILLPLIGNAAEHVTAVVASVKDRLDLTMHVAIGSSIQISLFVFPALVLLGWAIGQPLDLGLDLLEVILLFVGVSLVNSAISDGRSNFSEGVVLIAAYGLIALVAFYYPIRDAAA